MFSPPGTGFPQRASPWAGRPPPASVSAKCYSLTSIFHPLPVKFCTKLFCAQVLSGGLACLRGGTSVLERRLPARATRAALVLPGRKAPALTGFLQSRAGQGQRARLAWAVSSCLAPGCFRAGETPSGCVGEVGLHSRGSLPAFCRLQEGGSLSLVSKDFKVSKHHKTQKIEKNMINTKV